LCDCPKYFETGWQCAHVIAALALVDGFDLAAMLLDIPVRLPPGRPKKIPRALNRDAPSRTTGSYFSVRKLTDLLVRKPGHATNWSLQQAFTLQSSTGPSVVANLEGKILYWFEENGAYKWHVEFRDGTVKDLMVEELAEAIHDAHASGVSVVGSILHVSRP